MMRSQYWPSALVMRSGRSARMMSSWRNSFILPHSPGILARSAASIEHQLNQSSLFFSMSLASVAKGPVADSASSEDHWPSDIQRDRSSVIGGGAGDLEPRHSASYSAGSMTDLRCRMVKVSSVSTISLSRSNRPRRV